MNIALIGYGKMGKMIERIALERGHKIVSVIDAENRSEMNSEAFRTADCAIEFSMPSAALQNVKDALAQGVPVVCGTTGWTASLPEIKEICDNGGGTFLFASNFSVGVNIFMAVNRYLARIMNRFPQYHPSMEEIHHIHKLDHPSGTAITLAEEIVDETGRIGGWCESIKDGEAGKSAGDLSGEVLEIEHIRRGEVPGIHTIQWDSSVDTITISHSAKSREGFALGAVLSAEWLAGKTGFHTIGEVFEF